MASRQIRVRVELDAASAEREATQLQSIFARHLANVQMGGGRAGMPAGLPLGTPGGRFAGLAGGIAGGIIGGIAGVGITQVARSVASFGLELADLNRQSRLAGAGLEALAGGAEQADAAIAAVQESTGFTVDRIEAAQRATQLFAVGLAANAGDVERIMGALQGAAAATGASMDQLASQFTLAVSNQSLMRLDSLGLSVDEVKTRIAELRVEHKNWTDQMVYSEAILGRLTEKYGPLADAVKDNASGIQQLSTAWDDMKIAMSGAGGVIDDVSKRMAEMVRAGAEGFDRYAAMQELLKGTGAAADVFKSQVQALNNQLILGRITNEQYDASLAQIQGRYMGLAAAAARYPSFGGPGGGRTAADRAALVGTYPFAGVPGLRLLTDEQIAARERLRALQHPAPQAGFDITSYTSVGSVTALSGRTLVDAQLKSIGNVEDAWTRAAESVVNEFESRLQKVPGLFGVSEVTEQQMALGGAGIAQNFADDFLRQLEDEIEHGVDWPGVSEAMGRQALGRVGIQAAADPRLMVQQLREAWGSSQLFAAPENIRLINEQAVKAFMLTEEQKAQGRQNLLDAFSVAQDPEAVARLQAMGIDTVTIWSKGMLDQMPTLTQDVGAEMARGTFESFADTIATLPWLATLAAEIKASILADTAEEMNKSKPQTGSR